MSLINAGSSEEVFSFSFSGERNLLAAGCKSQVCSKIFRLLVMKFDMITQSSNNSLLMGTQKSLTLLWCYTCSTA